MTIDVKTIENCDIFQNGFKIFLIAFLLRVIFPISRIIRINAVQTYDEISCKEGGYGLMEKDEFMNLFMNIQ